MRSAAALALLSAGSLLTCSPAWSQTTPVALDAPWKAGAADCKVSPGAPIEVHAYNARTFILRESLCATFEAPIMYLLIGSSRALLIDSGDVADPKLAPLAGTVMGLLPGEGAAKLPLLVVHTHRHLDHRAGDPQFAAIRTVQVVGFDLDSVKRYYGFTDWPNGVAEIDLGARTVDVIPTPGHNATHVSFYDRNTGLFFSGDFLLPGRLLIEDEAADLASAKRVAAFVAARPVTAVLGGHVEIDAQGETFAWGSQFHPHEHALPMRKQDLLRLPAVLSKFNGFYTESDGLVMMSQDRILLAMAVAAGLVLLALGLGIWSYAARRRRRKQQRLSQA